jgi:hypothetical protein
VIFWIEEFFMDRKKAEFSVILPPGELAPPGGIFFLY